MQQVSSALYNAHDDTVRKTTSYLFLVNVRGTEIATVFPLPPLSCSTCTAVDFIPGERVNGKLEGELLQYLKTDTVW